MFFFLKKNPRKLLVLLATEKICRQHAFGTESLVGRQDSAGEAIQVYAAFVLLRSSLLGSKLCFFHCLAVPFVLANGLGPVDLLSQLLLASFDSFLLQAAQPPPPLQVILLCSGWTLDSQKPLGIS